MNDKLDSIDRQILALLNERVQACQYIAEGDYNDAALSPESTVQVVKAMLASNNGPVDGEAIQRVFREVVNASANAVKPVKVAYLGPEGTYTHAAVERYFGHSVCAEPVIGIAGIFDAVEAGQVQFGVVPVENSTEGTVNLTLDLLTQTSLRVCGEVSLRIQHCLLGSGHSLGDIKEVHAHPQSLAQCMHWLNANLPNAERVSESSNAAAAKLAVKRSDIAAIAGATAAELYGLTTLDSGIEDSKNNTTRFLVLGNDSVAPTGDDTSLLLVSAPHQPGGLRRILQPFEDAGVSMTRIESRPSRSKLWNYVFFIQVTGHEQERNFSKVLNQLRDVAPSLKVIGSYPRAL